MAADTDRRPRRQPLGEDDGVRESVRSAAFPTSPGVYVLYRAGEQRALYVGVAATQTIADRWRKQHPVPAAAHSGGRSGFISGSSRRS